ncbi:hypothetical protein [Nibrella saemangeumensis]
MATLYLLCNQQCTSVKPYGKLTVAYADSQSPAGNPEERECTQKSA